jgi:hypothetical protein
MFKLKYKNPLKPLILTDFRGFKRLAVGWIASDYSSSGKQQINMLLASNALKSLIYTGFSDVQMWRCSKVILNN